MNTQTNNTHKIKATSTQLNEMLEYYQGYLTYNSSNYIIARAQIDQRNHYFLSNKCRFISRN